MIERNNGYKKGEDGASREFIVTRSAFLQKKKHTHAQKKRERRERCPRLRVETFTREEEMRI